MADPHTPSNKRLIKKYPNRRLYDTVASGYITLTEVKQLVVERTPLQVVDAKTGDDITRSILLQIILEAESGGVPMFTNEMLEQLICFYEHSVQGVVGQLLEQNVKALNDIQASMTEQAKTLYGTQKPPMAEMWSQFLHMQAPNMNGMMGNYLEQSSKLFMDMQKQMQVQSKTLFPFPPPFPGFATPPPPKK
jgi:polyhydroxyalkanoate synthesis repressor PhaR